MAIAILFAATTGFAQAKKLPIHPPHAMAKQYTCTMHPEVVRNKPGKCPKCGMKLTVMNKTKMKNTGIQAEKSVREVKM